MQETQQIQIEPKQMQNIKSKAFDMIPKTFDESIKYAEFLSKSNILPANLQGRPHDVFAMVQTGLEIGITPMQAVRFLAVVNGRVSIWGDMMLALVFNSGLMESFSETIEGDIAICEVKRKGGFSHTSKFSIQDATTAGLMKKAGVWQQYPKRMLQLRARGFALRNIFPDVLNGLSMTEEFDDYIELNERGEVKIVEPKKQSEGKNQVKGETFSDKLANAIVIDDVHNPGYSEHLMAGPEHLMAGYVETYSTGDSSEYVCDIYIATPLERVKSAMDNNEAIREKVTGWLLKSGKSSIDELSEDNLLKIEEKLNI
jgi:hypothetical protein